MSEDTSDTDCYNHTQFQNAETTDTLHQESGQGNILVKPFLLACKDPCDLL
uniref:Uncharacterized protein n=1 Tax=Arion vulgaris TaxID=1028688 RepID=A0A0B7AGL3_9EUPU